MSRLSSATSTRAIARASPRPRGRQGAGSKVEKIFFDGGGGGGARAALPDLEGEPTTRGSAPRRPGDDGRTLRGEDTSIQRERERERRGEVSSNIMAKFSREVGHFGLGNWDLGKIFFQKKIDYPFSLRLDGGGGGEAGETGPEVAPDRGPGRVHPGGSKIFLGGVGRRRSRGVQIRRSEGGVVLRVAARHLVFREDPTRRR